MLAPWKKGYEQPRPHIEKQRHYVLTKVHIYKDMVFPIVMYGCGSWTIKKAERQRIYVFNLWCWRRLLRVPWAARRSNQPILKGINPEHSLKGLMLKFQYFGHLMWRANSLEKTLMLGKIEGKRENPMDGGAWWATVHGVTTISSAVIPFSSCSQSFPASGSFPMSQLFASSGQILLLTWG